MKKIPLLAACWLCCGVAAAQVTIDIDAADRGPKISPSHYGIFFEDINHAADGGLYAELIRNRSFEDGPAYGKPADMQHWSTYAALPAQLTARLIQPTKKTPLLNSAQQNALELTVNATPQQPACLVNTGYWGINAVQGRTYKLSLWLKAKYKGTIKARLQSTQLPSAPSFPSAPLAPSSPTTYAEALVTPSNETRGTWRKYTAELTAEANDPQAQFALVFDGKGTLQLDVVSLFPPTWKNRDNGLRPDLAQMLYEMHPKFMRFPGGCFVEGQISSENAFRWERTIGPIEERPGHWNVNWGYRTTDGIGFHEYLQMAEDLGAKPLYVVNVGIWHGGHTPLDSLQPWIDETLAALEYANGPVTSKYGALRAKNGHPEPFNIEYLEIGNENNQPDQHQQSDHYYERYAKFREAILAKYPKMQLIGNLVAWGDDNPKWESQLPVDLLDEHYYRTPAWFSDAFRKYDSYARTLPDGKPAPKIYVGEYAVTNGFGNLGNMNAALGEAIYMMGMENNSDIVPLNSYAPIFVNENDAKWRPDMIRFSSSRVMGTPSYYVQMLMPRNVGTQVVKVSQTNPYQAKALTKPITPKKSRVGYGSWATKASYTHMDPLPKTGKPQFVSGDWMMDNGLLRQTGMGEQCIALCTAEVGDHYTVKCRARKDDGREGFIIVFNYTDPEHYCWVNFGGWGNTQHGIEQMNGGKSQTATKRGRIESGRWYDVTLTVAGDSVKAWLDQELVFDTVLKHDTSTGIFSSATIDDASNELIVKIVNSQDEGTTARLNLKNFPVKSAKLIRLRANSGNDENTLQQPTNISPTEHELSPECNAVDVELQPYSLNIIRIKK